MTRQYLAVMLGFCFSLWMTQLMIAAYTKKKSTLLFYSIFRFFTIHEPLSHHSLIRLYLVKDDQGNIDLPTKLFFDSRGLLCRKSSQNTYTFVIEVMQVPGRTFLYKWQKESFLRRDTVWFNISFRLKYTFESRVANLSANVPSEFQQYASRFKEFHSQILVSWLLSL